jgi:hypothetical protein
LPRLAPVLGDRRRFFVQGGIGAIGERIADRIEGVSDLHDHGKQRTSFAEDVTIQ